MSLTPIWKTTVGEVANCLSLAIGQAGKHHLSQTSPFGTTARFFGYHPRTLLGRSSRTRGDKITEAALASSSLRLFPPWLPIIVVRSGILRNRFPVARCTTEFTVNQDLKVIVPQKDVDSTFLFWVLNQLESVVLRRAVKAGTTVESVDMQTLRRIEIPTPPLPQQRRIAEILSTLDEAIERTEGLIGKLQQIKAGLMHDLFTRGVTRAGHLRPPRDQAPHLYKHSPLGWIPNEWDVRQLENLYRTPIRDFGSFAMTNLITFLDFGVPFIKSEMIGVGEIIWDSVMFISEQVHQLLIKSHVQKGVILFSKIGSALGKAVIYDGSHGVCNSNAAVAKIGIDPRKADARFIMHFLNHDAARLQFRRIIVSLLPRINLGDIDRHFVPVPMIAEQGIVADRISACESQQRTEMNRVAKLREQKRGLMHDLLTGRVRVPVAAASEGGSA